MDIDKRKEHLIFGAALASAAPIAYMNARNLYRIEPNPHLKMVAKGLKYINPALLLAGGLINIKKAINMKKSELTKQAFFNELAKIL